MRRYLLRDLPEEERTRLEDRYAVDADVFEQILAIENDLIDSYIRGELTEVERQKFEAEFLKSAERREKVEFARALSHISVLAKPALPALRFSAWDKVMASFSIRLGVPQWALAAAAIVVVTGGSWLVVQNQRLRIDLRQALAGHAELRGEQESLRQQIAALERNNKSDTQQDQQRIETAKLEAPAGPEITIALIAGTARASGESQNTLVVPKISSWVRPLEGWKPGRSLVGLQLRLDRDEFSSYHAVLRPADDSKINLIDRPGLKSTLIENQRVVVLVLDSDIFRTEDYIVTLSGSNGTPGAEEEVEAYSFRVVRK